MKQNNLYLVLYRGCARPQMGKKGKFDFKQHLIRRQIINCLQDVTQFNVLKSLKYRKIHQNMSVIKYGRIMSIEAKFDFKKLLLEHNKCK